MCCYTLLEKFQKSMNSRKDFIEFSRFYIIIKNKNSRRSFVVVHDARSNNFVYSTMNLPFYDIENYRQFLQ